MDDGVIQRPKCAAFQERVGEEFTCELENGTVTLVLQNAKANDTADDGTVTAFSLLFNLKNDVPFQQGTLVLKHPALEDQVMFLVNVGPHQSGTGHLLEAIFN